MNKKTIVNLRLRNKERETLFFETEAEAKAFLDYIVKNKAMFVYCEKHGLVIPTNDIKRVEIRGELDVDSTD